MVAIDGFMATTIQISNDTQNRLFQLVAQLQTRLGRRVSYDEAIAILIDETQGARQAREEFQRLFGSLKGSETAWKELRELKDSEKRRIERLHRDS